ncbi:hypothetical protein F5144DRAFT_161423 [Chaetomium tenue]|uniref:Uncharacterized protein n=1 Tax=Chaetomium tenue TaxID=1854479 RepID=A0ACB7P9W2_9PEZI|nr:hypothetical protein F5144DRAFT_161423 [Chaetomium globosum]
MYSVIARCGNTRVAVVFRVVAVAAYGAPVLAVAVEGHGFVDFAVPPWAHGVKAQTTRAVKPANGDSAHGVVCCVWAPVIRVTGSASLVMAE